jgi:aconitate hydratase
MFQRTHDSFSCRKLLSVDGETFEFFSFEKLAGALGDFSDLPFSLKILLENLLRNEDGLFVKAEDIKALAGPKQGKVNREIAFMPARVLMQDFTGVPAIVDLAAMRDAVRRLGGDAGRINPLIPVDLVVDHSVQVDYFGTPEAFEQNSRMEFDRNRERYAFLRWGQKAFRNFRVVPPETGIIHQINLEYLAQCVLKRERDGKIQIFPDSVFGTDSHTTTINSLGVLGWGVGGIEAEAAMLGQPSSMIIPDVLGFKLTGQLNEGVTATDAVLTITEILRRKGVVGKFVEFFGPGLDHLPLADRATIANMAPEYGATAGFFPIDKETLAYLELTGRDQKQIRLVETYMKEQGLFRDAQTRDPHFDETLQLDLGSIELSMAGPKRPQERVPLKDIKESWRNYLSAQTAPSPALHADSPREGEGIRDGSVVIAAITSCTNTSNPSVMLGAGLLAKKAVEKGLSRKPWVKTSLAPGSKVVMDYLRGAGVLPYLEKLGFNLVGFGCTTCIGNSGPLIEPVADAVRKNNLVVAAVLSGNRNFEGRINALVKANYLASPVLVVAYALAGKMDFDPYNEPLGMDVGGKAVYLRDIWPTNAEIQTALRNVSRKMFSAEYANAFDGDARWRSLNVAESELYAWDITSTYIKNPPYFDGLTRLPIGCPDIRSARVLALLGDSVTTDHISPAGSIPRDSAAGKYLASRGVDSKDFNSYGSRRGNDEVMVRGTFANIRLRNLLVPGVEGGWTVHLPDKKQTTIFEASEQYKIEGVPLVVIAGKEYGSGSSRDWAAKGPALLGVKAVIAESYERIHRSNLIGMGIAPLQFKQGENRETLGLAGDEIFEIKGIAVDLRPGKDIVVETRDAGGKVRSFLTVLRIDTPEEIQYYRHGGILPYVLRQLIA